MNASKVAVALNAISAAYAELAVAMTETGGFLLDGSVTVGGVFLEASPVVDPPDEADE